MPRPGIDFFDRLPSVDLLFPQPKKTQVLQWGVEKCSDCIMLTNPVPFIPQDAMSQSSESLQQLFRGEVEFDGWPWHFHAANFAKRHFGLIATESFAIFSVFWTLSETSIQFLETEPRGLRPYIALIVLSTAIATLHQGWRFATHIPEGLEQVPPRAQRIARWRRRKWEYQFAKALLADRLFKLEKRLEDLSTGKTFVVARRRSVQSYVLWLSGRPTNMQRMISVGKRVLADYIAALQSTKERPTTPLAILNATDALAEFYATTIEFEREGLAIIPPENFERAHTLQLNWSYVLRDAVQELFKLLQRVVEHEESDSTIHFTIDLKMPKTLEEFGAELDRLGA